MRMLLLLWMLLSALLASARESSLYFEKITVQNGLSHNKVNCILQDQRGFIWLGTDDGLNRFDGKRFLHFRSSRNDSTKLSGNIITDLLEDREGRIWIATADGGLVCYDHKLPPQQQFRNCRNRIAGAPPVYSINTLLEDPQGYLWLGTSGHDVIRYDKKKDLYRSITTSSKTILDLCLDSQGMIWVGRQGGGIMKINPLTLSYSEDERYADFYASLPHVTVTALFKDRQDEMWFGSWDRVLYRYHPVRLQEEVFSLFWAF